MIYALILGLPEVYDDIGPDALKMNANMLAKPKNMDQDVWNNVVKGKVECAENINKEVKKTFKDKGAKLVACPPGARYESELDIEGGTKKA